jgi:hypothetical protein
VENHFSYFTEIEERFQQCRGTLTILSSLDWALIESWKEAGVPLEAVLRGIERAFEKHRSRPRPGRSVNSVTYCTQEVLRAAEELSGAAGRGKESKAAEASAPFKPEDVRNFFSRNIAALEKASRTAEENRQPVLRDDLAACARELRGIAEVETAKILASLQQTETQLTALEEKLTASLTRSSSTEMLTQFHQEVERALTPARRRMTGAQIESLARQFVKKRLFEHYQVPRLSLFYL